MKRFDLLGGGGNRLSSYSNGFTLAEVLVTLGIIGIVAALTMPALIANYQLKSFETAFKKQYSVLNNTLDFIQLDESLNACYVTIVNIPIESNPDNKGYGAKQDECYVLKRSMIDKLKLVPIENDYTYPSLSKVLSEGGVSINSTYDYDTHKKYSAFMLPDGAVIRFLYGENVVSRHNINFVVDVNGKKGPNKWGYDVFYLTSVLKNGKLRLTDEYASLAQKGGRLPRTILMNKDKNDNTNRDWD